ncbi:hypothetical protein K431DRAFT_129811 [Polychaeton citri CBS 116435]|uniref:Uncharacterized protein n=1 Tax=Polychaeton citri CBS 116435 TaxID=1314669 RepID=A0A9P4Q2F5_9PEZI|nr:hypothetical protein K431DRAFT_129811 [Polychaeton citri CBS 116435]
MAHKQLIDRYSKQICDNNVRILYLESQLADRDSQLQLVLDGASNSDAQAHAKFGQLEQLIRAVTERDDANARLKTDLIANETRLSSQIQTLSYQLQDSQRENKELKEALCESRRLNSAIEERVRILIAKIQQLERRHVAPVEPGEDFTIAAQLPWRPGSTTSSSITRHASFSHDLAANDRTPDTVSILESKLKQAIDAHKSEIGLKNGQLALQQSLLNNALDQVKELSPAHTYPLPKRTSYALPVHFLEELDWADEEYGNLRRKRRRNGEDPGLSRMRNGIVKLKADVHLEKKRRLEAEAMLGPDGKRCRRCHPVVVELVDGEELGVGGVMWREVASRIAQK